MSGESAVADFSGITKAPEVFDLQLFFESEAGYAIPGPMISNVVGWRRIDEGRVNIFLLPKEEQYGLLSFTGRTDNAAFGSMEETRVYRSKSRISVKTRQWEET